MFRETFGYILKRRSIGTLSRRYKTNILLGSGRLVGGGGALIIRKRRRRG
jgi:hypothetical protein